MEATCLSTDKMDKEDVIHAQWNIDQSRKEGNLPSETTWMDLVYTIISEVSQRETCMISLYVAQEKLHL